MISGFGSSNRANYIRHADVHSISHFPVPFNIPNVLYNLIFEDIGIEFDAKQKDMLETLRFSYNAFAKFQASYATRTEELKEKIIHNPQDEALKQELEDLQLELFQASYQYKEIVTAMSELLKREQYEKLLRFSNIPT